MQFIATSARNFQPFEGAPGMHVCVMADHGDGGVSLLVKLDPGAKVPRHEHLGREENLILQGKCDVGGQVAGPGDYVRMDTDDVHEIRAIDETIFFVVVNKGYKLAG